MRNWLALISSALLFTACGPMPHDSQDGPAIPPADAPAGSVDRPDPARFAGPLELSGVNSNWSGQMIGNRLIVNRAGFPEQLLDLPEPVLHPSNALWIGPTFTFRLEALPCAAGQGTDLMPLTAYVTLNGEKLKGCAGPATETP